MVFQTNQGVDVEALNFIALSNHIVLEIIKRERTKGNIIIPDIAKVPVIEGVVRGVSEVLDAEGNRMVRHVKIGDRVLFNINAGQFMEIDGGQYLILRESDLYGILTGEVIEVPKSSNLTLLN